MPFDINFGALQQANPFAAYAQGQEIGQQNRVRQARQAAGNIFATDPDQASQILMGAGDWEGGLTARKYATEDRQMKARSKAVTQYNSGDKTGAQATALGAGLDELATHFTTLSDAEMKRERQNNEDRAAYAYTMKSAIQSGQMTPEQAKAHILEDKPRLLQLGYSEQQIDGFEPTIANFDHIIGQGLTVKDAMDQADKARTFQLQQQQLEETKRNHRATEGIAAKNASTAAFSAQTGRMSYNARKAAGGFGTPGVGGVLGPTLPGDPNDWEINPAGGR